MASRYEVRRGRGPTNQRFVIVDLTYCNTMIGPFAHRAQAERACKRLNDEQGEANVMTDEEIREAVATLPSMFGPNARQSIAYLMKTDGLSLDDALLKFEEMISDVLVRAAQRENSTGVK